MVQVYSLFVNGFIYFFLWTLMIRASVDYYVLSQNSYSLT